MIKNIIFASDYQGIDLREKLVKSVTKKGFLSQDLGIYLGSKIDYIDLAKHLAEEVRLNPEAIGIMVCGSGQGVAMGLNRFTHIRAGVCRTVEDAVQIREQLNANVLCLGGQKNSFFESLEIVEKFVETPFNGGKHTACIQKLTVNPTQHGEKKINIIVQSIIIHDNHILLTTATDENPYFSSQVYFLPGGHVDYNESCLTALKRELFEEALLSIDSAEFSGALECSWDRQGNIYHEINIIYQTKIKDLDIEHPPISTEAYQKFIWIPLNNLSQMTILPKKLHRVITDGKSKFYSEL